jgi:hypothetical protein
MFTYDIEVSVDDLKGFQRNLEKRVGDELAKRMLDAGAYLTRTVKNSMRKASRGKDARPGQAPYSHEFTSKGTPQQKNLRSEMRFVADPAAGEVVVGPLRFNSNVVLPGLMERGGTLKIGNARRRNRKVGHGGEIDIVGRRGSSKRLYGSGGNRRRSKGKTTRRVTGDAQGRHVVYVKLGTAAQVRRANELNELLYGAWETKVANYSPHPYLAPALDRVRSTGKFDDILDDVVGVI